MRWNWWQLGAIPAAVAAVLAAAGCPGGDKVLESGNFGASFATGTVHPTSANYQCVAMSFDQLVIRPADGVCSAGSVNAGALCGIDSQCLSLGTCQLECSSASTNGGNACSTDAECPPAGVGSCGVCSDTSDTPGAACDNNADCPGHCDGASAQDALNGDPIIIVPNTIDSVGFLDSPCRRCSLQNQFCSSGDDCGTNACVTLQTGEKRCEFSTTPCNSDADCATNVCRVRDFELPSTTLSEGTYLIESLQVGKLQLFNPGGTPSTFGCDSTIPVEGAYHDPPLTLTVGPGRANTFRFVLDLQGIEDTVINGGGCGGQPAGDDPTTFFGHITSILTLVQE